MGEAEGGSQMPMKTPSFDALLLSKNKYAHLLTERRAVGFVGLDIGRRKGVLQLLRRCVVLRSASIVIGVPISKSCTPSGVRSDVCSTGKAVYRHSKREASRV